MPTILDEIGGVCRFISTDRFPEAAAFS